MNSSPSSRSYTQRCCEILESTSLSLTQQMMELKSLLLEVLREKSVDYTILRPEESTSDPYIRWVLQVADKVIRSAYTPTPPELQKVKTVTLDYLEQNYNTPLSDEDLINIDQSFLSKTYHQSIKVRVIKWQDQILIASPTDCVEATIQISLDELFHPELKQQIQRLCTPKTIFRINECHLKEGVYFPLFFIIQPDYLLDVTSVSESLQDTGSSRLHYLMTKYSTIPNSKHILMGNLANQMVDEMVNITEIDTHSVMESMQKAFSESPVAYTTSADLQTTAQVSQFANNAQLQADHIKFLFKTQPELQAREHITLEPTYISEYYGLQGRMDILITEADHDIIIELKSGQGASPEDGKPKINHISQLMMYYMLYSSANTLPIQQLSQKLKGAVMYSKQASMYRIEPDTHFMQLILYLRNQIVSLEQQLSRASIPKQLSFYENLQPTFFQEKAIDQMLHDLNYHFDRGMNFAYARQDQFCTAFKGLTSLQQKYFAYFNQFISTEQYYSKVGHTRRELPQGHATFWQLNPNEKKAQFDILYDLKIVENTLNTTPAYISLKRTNEDNRFVNFRVGDMCVLYPQTGDRPTSHRLFKGYISHLSVDMVRINFRHVHNDLSYFDQFSHWHIERDYLDSSFRAMSKQLFGFISNTSKFSPLIIGNAQPKHQTESLWNYHNETLSPEHNRILNKALDALDYFILNGPPGTGKTSLIIHHLVKEYVSNSELKIVLLTYTNRAADELSEAVSQAFNALGLPEAYLRIGSLSNCDPKYQDAMLQEQMNRLLAEENVNRKTVKHLLDSKQVMVSTVSSFQNNVSLIAQPENTVIVIDEASQILEPQIIDILRYCSKFIMIGDHKQLPAISQQEPAKIKVTDAELNAIGLYSTANSLFERLYTLCHKNQWTHAYDGLTHQGRMHRDIMQFVNQHFYDSELNLAYDTPALSQKVKQELKRQIDTLDHQTDASDKLNMLLATERMVFIDSQTNETLQRKSSTQEAQSVVDIIERLQRIYTLSGKTLLPFEQVGIITPFRSQIALIKQYLELSNVKNHDDIMVDTVERFQGSQKDIIILSMVVSDPKQLAAISNLDATEKVDRKLNVALTRAKEQVILLGQESILRQNPLYYALLNSMVKV